jgi:flagellar biosynthetic protein FliQ
MTPESVMDLAYQGMRVALLLASPMLATALFIGLFISLIQAVTQINEMTLSFIPKILGVCTAIVLAGPWLLQLIVSYTVGLFQGIPLMLQ